MRPLEEAKGAGPVSLQILSFQIFPKLTVCLGQQNCCFTSRITSTGNIMTGRSLENSWMHHTAAIIMYKFVGIKKNKYTKLENILIFK